MTECEEDESDEDREKQLAFNQESFLKPAALEDTIDGKLPHQQNFHNASSETLGSVDSYSKSKSIPEKKNNFLMSLMGSHKKSRIGHPSDWQMEETHNLVENELYSFEISYQGFISKPGAEVKTMLDAEERDVSATTKCNSMPGIQLLGLRSTKKGIFLYQRNRKSPEVLNIISHKIVQTRSASKISCLYSYYSANLWRNQQVHFNFGRVRLCKYPADLLLNEQRSKRESISLCSFGKIPQIVNDCTETLGKENKHGLIKTSAIFAIDCPLIGRSNSILFSGSEEHYFENCLSKKYTQTKPRELTTWTNTQKLKRIFNLAANFDLPRGIAMSEKREALRTVNEALENYLAMEDIAVLIKSCESKNKSSDRLECSAQSADAEPCSRTNSAVELHISEALFDKLKQSVCVSKETASYAEQKQAPMFSQCSSRSKEAFSVVTLIPQRMLHEKPMFPEVSNAQLDIFSSATVKPECSDISVFFGSFDEHLPGIEKDKSLLSLEPVHSKDPLHSKASLKLPLSLQFALQLIEHFGSPGVCIDSLTLEDFIVPLDWDISRMIHSQWKATVKKRHQKNISEKANALTGSNPLQNDTENHSKDYINTCPSQSTCRRP
ncbi:uncharacterized protein LOC115092117 isoform X7 [Rhinatrema bivittatum]|uniref:uncharacterized protein LOC115092117 isoform X7 n=1 Tax=Rhinatrema bivittatum TaxID=194408 RepID=UPI001127668B|nr:uncharacterized protein LOC115092117 isoform X7 [Rhinatrema bivittatum]XP_029458526.1 uncharacterized protein LOC115092117 isoform X7 [Rhinatrema bivittatum]